tara:strand:- start:37855 stop:38028 length:174 start_codon:yes stop_codon:yes gene_type:complete
MLEDTGRLVVTFENASQEFADKVVKNTGETLEQVIEKLIGEKVYVDFLKDHCDIEEN